jgi:hypothetical protein
VPPAPVPAVQVQVEVQPEEFVGASQVRSYPILFRKHGASDRLVPDQPSITEQPPSPAPSLSDPRLTYLNLEESPDIVCRKAHLRLWGASSPTPITPSTPAGEAECEAGELLPPAYTTPTTTTVRRPAYRGVGYEVLLPAYVCHRRDCDGDGDDYYGEAGYSEAQDGLPRPESYWNPHSENVGASAVIEEPEEMDDDEIGGIYSNCRDPNLAVAVEHWRSVRTSEIFATHLMKTHESARGDNDAVPTPVPIVPVHAAAASAAASVPTMPRRRSRPRLELRLQTRLQDQHSPR